MLLATGRRWGTEITRDREQSRGKKKMGLSQNKKRARANRELWYSKVRGINGTAGRVKNVRFCRESWKQGQGGGRGAVRGQCKHNRERKKKSTCCDMN